MGFMLAEAYVQIGVKSLLDSGFARAKNQTVHAVGELNRIASGIGGGFAMIAGAGAIAGLGALAAGLYKGVQGAADLGETVSKVGQVFGDEANKITGLADSMASAYGTPKKAILDAAASFGLLGQSAGQTAAQSADLATTMAKLAMDATSFYDVPLNVALEKIRSGLVGEAEPLRAFGVLLSEGAVKAEAARLGIAKLGAELTEQQKLQARASLIQNAPSMRKAAGDLDRTKDSPKNRQREIAGRSENALISIGEAVMPVWQEIINQVNGVAVAIGGLIEQIKPKIMEWSESAVGSVKTVTLGFYSLLDSITAFAGSTAIQAWGADVGGVLNWVGGVFGSTFETIGLVLRNVDEIIELTRINWTESFANMIIGVEWFADATGKYLGWIEENWLALYTDIMNAQVAFFSNLLTNAANFGVALWDAIQGKGFDFTFTPMLDGFKATMKELPKIAAPAWANMDKERAAVLEKMGANEARHATEMASRAAQIAKKGQPGAAKKDDTPAGGAAGKATKIWSGGLEEFAKHLQDGVFGKDDSARKTADNTAKIVQGQADVVAAINRTRNNAGLLA